MPKAPQTLKDRATLHQGDCLSVLRTLPDNSVDSVVTDPPYGLKFMGRKWDCDVPPVEVWAECLRVLKPGGHLLAFAGTRTQHRMAVRIEDAGFEIRDMIAWVYGSGFPKSLDVSKEIDRMAGAEPIRLGLKFTGDGRSRASDPSKGKADRPMHGGGINGHENDFHTAPATEAAKQWEGWGTALKPALEPITVARKPFPGTVAANVLQHGTGAINIGGCRVGTDQTVTLRSGSLGKGIFGGDSRVGDKLNPPGRWPANLIHDGSDEVVGLFPVTGASQQRTGKRTGKRTGILGDFAGQHVVVMGHNDTGSAARYFYCAKASNRDRDEGCEGMEERARPTLGSGIGGQPNQQRANNRNHHPTVKPTDLMRYLCRLVTPPGGVILDPYMGSGSTGKGAMLEGFRFIGIEREADFMRIARARILEALKVSFRG